MKRILIIAIIATIGGLSAMAQNNPVNNQTPTSREHRNFVVDNGHQYNLAITLDEVNAQLVVEGIGMSESFMATVAAAASPQVVLISTIVDATDNTVDVSMLDDGTYTITLMEPLLGRTACTRTFVIAGGLPSTQQGWNPLPLNKRDLSNVEK